MRIIDLFSGAGGLTFGFYYKRKGTQFVRNRKNHIVFANEIDLHAANAFSLNYPDITMINQDIKSLSDKMILDQIGEEPIDLIIGGPPCQPFSTVGQRVFDDKALLYEEYARVLRIVRPKMFLFENVKGILSMREAIYKKDKDGNVLFRGNSSGDRKKRPRPEVESYGRLLIDIIKKKFEKIDNDLGYAIHKKIINAVDFGVPENRERVFIVGIRDDLVDLDWVYPKVGKGEKLSVKDAISDFPAVEEGQQRIEYEIEPQNEYQKLMRTGNKRITFHYCGIYGEKMRTVIRHVKQGQGKEDFNALVDAGIVSKDYYLTSGYPNTYGRLVESQPCTTITNNLSTPSGLRCIHYEQDRALTPREGARIQSFPDWFQFEGNKDQVTAQIGNAVPPLLAMAFAKKIESTLKRANN